jgi:hypothetical protein
MTDSVGVKRMLDDGWGWATTGRAAHLVRDDRTACGRDGHLMRLLSSAQAWNRCLSCCDIANEILFGRERA